MTRTDIHRPSAPEFDPQGYDLFGVFDLDPEWGTVGRTETVNSLLDEGYRFTSVHGEGRCGHCGAYLRYAALMGHTETKGLIWVGETCLDNRFALTKPEFDALRKTAALNKERRAKNDRMAEFLTDHPALVWASYAHNIGEAGATVKYYVADDYSGTEYDTEEEARATLTNPVQREDFWAVGTTSRGGWSEQTHFGKHITTLTDMWHRFAKYGEMSDKAYAYMESILGWMEEAEAKRVEREAAQQAKVERGAQVTAGRQVIEGEVTTTKWVTNDYGTVQKMRVVSGDLAYWGTVPSALYDAGVDKGSMVRFTATVEPSKDDPSFGFFKRPSKAEVL